MDACEKREYRIIRMERTTSLESCVDAGIAGVDDNAAYPIDTSVSTEARLAPFWQPQCADDVDKLIAAQQMRIDYWQEIADRAKDALTAAKTRQARILDAYSDIIQAVTVVPEGKSYKTWRGPYSLGNYRNQPERAPVLRLVNPELALTYGLAKQVVKIELDRDACKAALREDLTPDNVGIEAVAPAAISYTAPKGD